MFKTSFFRFLGLLLISMAVLSAAVNIVPVQNGYFYTDSMYSKIYFSDGKQVSEILSGPGFGYFNISPDETMIGFKFRDTPGGKEAAAIYNIATKKVTLLHEPVYLAGQPSFSDQGHVAYTVENTLFVKDGVSIKSYDLGLYASNAPISPDGMSVAFNNDADQLFIMDLNDQDVIAVSDNSYGNAYPQWSYNGKFLSYYSFDGKIWIYDKQKEENLFIGEGGDLNWSPISNEFSYSRIELINDEIVSAEIVLANVDREVLHTLNSNGIKNQQTFFDKSGSLSYINKNNDLKSFSETSLKKRTNKKILLSTAPVTFEQRTPATDTFLDVPYIHQVYDTPGSRGYSSCGPTTAAMVLAYYGLLPKWPFLSGFSNWSDYGAYVHERYYYRDTYFNLTYTDCNSSGSYCYTCYGGMGYMWNGGSPNSKMAGYYTKHGIGAHQTWNTNWATVANEIDKLQPFSICNFLTGSGHLIVAKGRVENGQRTVITNDPYGNKNTPGYPSYDGKTTLYDWPGYNHGHVSLNAANTSYGSQMPWCIATDYTAPALIDSIVDDKQFNDGFYIKAEGNTVPMRYYRSTRSGYGGHHWWTYTEETAEDICYVTWTPQVDDGYYEVYTYIPAAATARSALYKIKHAAGEAMITVDQSLYPDSWVFLGKYMMVNDGSNYVYLGDSTGVSGEKIAFDAVKWLPATQEELDFSSDHQQGYKGYKVNFYVISDFTAGDYTYIWDFGDGGTATGDSVWHIYEETGTYSITLQAEAGSIVVSEEKVDYIQINDNTFTGTELELIYPDSLSSVDTKYPVLTWKNTSETYTLNLCSTPDMDSLILDVNTGDNWYEISEELVENNTYYWVVNSNGGNSSRVWAFHINTENSLPGPFDLVSPEDDFVSDTLRPAFSWTNATDKDPGDETLLYKLLIGTDEENMTCMYEGYEKSCQLNEDLDENGSYTWYVQAVDQTHAFTRSTSSRTIGINSYNEAPPAPVQIAPNHNSYQTTRYPHLEWTAVVDPDPGDKVHYEVFYWYDEDKILIINTEETYHNERRFRDLEEYSWTVAAVDLEGEYSYSDTQIIYIDSKLDIVDIPEEYRLYGNYPNPFNPVTTIAIGLPASEEIELNVYDINGRFVQALANGYFSAGNYEFHFDAEGLPSGIYVYKLKAGEFISSSKMLLLK